VSSQCVSEAEWVQQVCLNCCKEIGNNKNMRVAPFIFFSTKYNF
jgi:hypothetical protein